MVPFYSLVRFPVFTFHSIVTMAVSCIVSEIKRDICEKIVILSYPLAFDAPARGFPSEYRHPVWDGKTRMVSLPDGEKILKISLFVLT